MTAPSIVLRDGIATLLTLKRDLGEFTWGNNFIIEKTYYPRDDLEEFNTKAQNGYIFLVNLSSGGMRINRAKSQIRQIFSELHFFKTGVNPFDTSEIDSLVSFVEEELTQAVIKELDLLYSGHRYEFSSWNYMDSDEEFPYSYFLITNTGLFLSKLTFLFTLPSDPP